METLLSFFQGFINLGAAVMLPVVIAILGLFFGMKLGQAIKSGLFVGIGFQGLCLAVNLLTTTIQPVMDYYAQMDAGYDVLEIGFAALGGAAWTVPFAVLAIPAIVIINLILVRLKITKVLNVDIWNFMHFLVPGALAYALFGSALLGFCVTVALSVITLFFAQWAAPKWGEFYGLEGTTCTTLAFAAWVYPVSTGINWLIDHIPGLNKLDLDMDKLGSKLGVFGDPAVIGIVVGAFLGLLTRQSISSLLTICMGVAAVMVLIPRMVGIMMEGLSPIGTAANAYMKLGSSSQVQQSMEWEALIRGTKSKAFSRAGVERGNHSLKVLRRNRGEVKLFREILAEQTVGVFIKATLSRTARVSKKFFCPQDMLHGLIVKEFISIVYCEGTKQGWRERSKGRTLGLGEDFCLSVWQKAGNQEPGAAVHKGGQSSFSPRALYSIAFPMPKLRARVSHSGPVMNRFVPVQTAPCLLIMGGKPYVPCGANISLQSLTGRHGWHGR